MSRVQIIQPEGRGANQDFIFQPEWRSLWLFFNTIRRRVDNQQVESRGVGGAEENRSFDFHTRSLVSSIWGLCFGGEFAKFGDIPLLMAGGEVSLKLHESESDLEAVKMEESKETMRAEP